MSDHKINSGFRVVGPTSVSGELHCWFAPTLEEANRLAKSFAQDNGCRYDVCEFRGAWVPSTPPVEFIPCSTIAEVKP